MKNGIFVALVALAGCVCAAEEFSWDGVSPGSEFKFSEKRIEVESGSIVRFDIGWTKKEWNFGSAAYVQIKWDNESGKQLAITALDSRETAIPKVHNYPCVESAALSALDRPIPVRAYLKVPGKAKYATVGFLFCGNACRLTLDEAKVSPVDASKKPWERRRPPKRMIKFGPDPYTDAEVAAALKSRPRAFPKIVRDGDRVELEVNGERIFPGIRHAGRRDTPRGVREFSKIGFRIFNVNLYVGKTTYTKEPQQIAAGQILKEDGSYDIPLMERRVYDILRQDTNAYVILVCKVSATDAWKRANPLELERHAEKGIRVFKGWKYSDEYVKEIPDTPGDSAIASVFSRKFSDDMSRSFAEAMRRFEQTDASKAVIGVYVVGGDDSQFRLQLDPWTSANAPAEFRRFLKEKYGSDSALAAAWGVPGATVSGAQVPSEADILPDCEYVSVRPSPASDFREFCAMSVARMNCSFRAGVKAGAPRLLAGGYSGAATLGVADGRGRYALSKMMNDPNTDFIIWLPGYSRRRDEITIPLGRSAFNGSMVLHNKLQIAEMDVRYPYANHLQSNIYKSDRWQECHDDATFRNFLSYFAAASFAWGGIFHAYPLSPAWYDYPEAMAAWKNASDIVRHSHGREYSEERIAAFFDERSSDFISWKFNPEIWRCSAARTAQVCDMLWRVGARSDYYISDDILSDGFAAIAPKVLLLNDLSTMTPEKIAAVRKKYAKPGRVLLWVGNPAFHSGASMDEISRCFGLGVEIDDCRKPIVAAGADDPLCRGVKGFWNEPCQGIERKFPTAYRLECRNGWKPIANFAGTDRCAAAVRRTDGFAEIIVGAPGSVTPQFMRNVCRESGFEPVMENDDFYIEGGGLMVIGACVRDGKRTLRLPSGVKSLKPLTGQKVSYPRPGIAEVDIDCGAAAVFAELPAVKETFK